MNAAAASTRLDMAFGALADPTRRAIVRRLADGEASILSLAEPFAMSLPAFSKHVRILERSGLVMREKRGRTHYCRLCAEPLRDADSWISFYRTFWQERFDSLDQFLEKNP